MKKSDKEEFNVKRINGYLDIDEYFFKRLKRKFIDYEDLELNGLITTELAGRSNKFWILSKDNNEKIALFKEQQFGTDEGYAELFAEEIAKILKMPSAHYDLAIFDGKKGVISYNFIKEYDSLYSGTDIILDFYEKKLEGNRELSELYGIDIDNDNLDIILEKLNNLEDIWFILEDKFKDCYDRELIVGRIVNGLVDKLIFDILTVNVDDHCDNWGIMDDSEEGKKIAHQFDNARILNLHHNILIEKYVEDKKLTDKELSLTVDNLKIKKPLEVLQHFLNISSSEYRDLVKEKIDILQEHIDEIPTIIETRTCNPVPRYLNDYFKTNMHEHLNAVNEIVSNKRKK